MAVGGLLAICVVVAAVVFLLPKRDAALASHEAESVQAQGPKIAPPAPRSVAPLPGGAERQAAVQQSVSPATHANRPLDPADALAQVYEHRELDHGVSVTLERTAVRVGKDKLRFRVQSDRPGYLYILMLGTDKQHINLLFPNSLDQENRTEGNQPINLPRAGWAMTAGGPPGTNQFIALVSERPRDFGRVGLMKVGPFAEFSLDKVAALLRSGSGDAPVLAGTPMCASSSPCSAAYGAAQFSIEEIN